MRSSSPSARASSAASAASSGASASRSRPCRARTRRRSSFRSSPNRARFDAVSAPLASVPARVATSAYAAAAPGVEAFTGSAPALTFADLLAQAEPITADLPPVPEELVPELEEFVPLVAPPEPAAARIDVVVRGAAPRLP